METQRVNLGKLATLMADDYSALEKKVEWYRSQAFAWRTIARRRCYQCKWYSAPNICRLIIHVSFGPNYIIPRDAQCPRWEPK